MTGIFTENGISRNSRLLLLALLLTVVAGIPRLYQLGDLGFYMDEETTSFASRSLAEGLPAQMPSGMPYHRAILQSYLNALSARVFGLDNEFSYRLPSAIFGILTVPLLFLLVRPYTGTSIAFIVALLLALSEWHIFTARQARMYAPFLFFYIACVFSILRWAQSNSNRDLVISLLLFGAAATTHQFGIFAALIPFVALSIQDFSRTPTYKLALFSVTSGVSAALYGSFFVDKAYQLWKTSNGIETASTATVNRLPDLQAMDYRLLVAGSVSILLGMWLARLSAFPSTGIGKYWRIAAHYLLAMLFAGLAATANLHGAFLAILLLLFLYPGTLADFLKSSYKPLTAITVLTFLSAGLVVMDSGVLPGLKSMSQFPHQYWTLLNDLSPAITLLFLAALLYLAAGNKQAIGKPAYIMAICALFPLILVGSIKHWVPARYIITAYPFILITTGLFLYTLVKNICSFCNISSETPVTTISITIILSGIIGGHSVMSAYKAATLTYGDPVNEAAHIFPVHPDHKHTGEYVATHSSIDDLILAEDILEQQWYAGRVDYWLRDHKSHNRYLYKGHDNELHDIYVNSIVATPEILDKLTANHDKRIWLITSGETFHQRKQYLNTEQQAWLDAIEKNNQPVFTGKDNISFVYCLHCEENQ